MLVSVTLEDSIGDILRKARISVAATPDSVAAAAGLSLADYEKLEETGRSPKAIQYSGVARLLTLDGKKLERIASGWLPAPVDLGAWRELRVITTADPGDGMLVHAYLVWDEVTREAALFDTAARCSAEASRFSSNGLVRKSSIPASRQRSRSPAMAFAVSAIT